MKATPWIIPVVAVFSLFLVSCSYISQFQKNPAGEESPLAGIINEDIGLPAPEQETKQQEQAGNNAPQEAQGKFTVMEGETVKLRPRATDPDEDALAYRFSYPLDQEGEWQTKQGDAGEYPVTVTVSDGKSSAVRQVIIIVKPLNSPPVLEVVSEMVVPEGSTVLIDAQATDPDNDTVKITYSGWMANRSKATGYQDAGTYTVIVTASDGKVSVSKDILITITDVNRPPVIESIGIE
ncbi:hypothetical protein HY491_04385 [Candidatus Woesearchaeota archaeon]|nr:hypothetical protein [Candidatus Woesearchaeota archaeon]